MSNRSDTKARLVQTGLEAARKRGRIGGRPRRMTEDKIQAIDAIQGLIDHIKVTPTNTGFDVELHGELGAIMEMVDQNDRRPAGKTAGRSFSVVWLRE